MFISLAISKGSDVPVSPEPKAKAVHNAISIKTIFSFHREADFSGIRIDEIVKNKQPMEQITVRKMEVSNPKII